MQVQEILPRGVKAAESNLHSAGQPRDEAGDSVRENGSDEVPGNRSAEPATRRWAVVLAGGDGTRLRGLTRFLCGDDRPKQFCRLLGEHSLLGQTIRRAQRSVPSQQILSLLTQTHREFYAREVDCLEACRIVQPANKGTAPAILFGALSVQQIDQDALVAILPSDHHYLDDMRFTHALESAFDIASERPESVVLFGAQPDRPEVEYGWIELGPRLAHATSEICAVQRFWEKPPLEVAQALLGRDCVWNTFVMVGHVRAFLELSARAIPDVLRDLGRAQVWSGCETQIEHWIYNRMPSTDFSRHVLSTEFNRLLVLRVRDLGWSDLGHPERVLVAVEEGGLRPSWTTAWKQAQPATI